MALMPRPRLVAHARLSSCSAPASWTSPHEAEIWRYLLDMRVRDPAGPAEQRLQSSIDRQAPVRPPELLDQFVVEEGRRQVGGSRQMGLRVPAGYQQTGRRWDVLSAWL